MSFPRAVGAFALFFFACSATVGPLDAYRGALGRRYSAYLPTWRAGYDGAPTVVGRNRIVDDLTWLVDAAYYDAEQRMLTSRTIFETAAGLIGIGLSAAGASVPALALAASGVLGATGEIDKQLFREQSQWAIAARMRANREAVRTEIAKHELQPVAAYTLEQALLDVQAYMQAGTLSEALRVVTTQATEQLEQTSKERRSLPPQLE